MDELMQIMALERLEELEHQQRLNNQRNTKDPFIYLNERQFINMFRLTKNLCQFLIDILEPHMRPKIRTTDLDIKTRVLIALRFYAGGSYQQDVASNRYLDVCQSTVSVSLREVTEALNNPAIFNEWVRFPQTIDELNNIRLGFFQQHNFPGVIGCIDGTHVAIYPPNIQDPEYPEYLYINRKNYHSINVQLICDANLKILNVNAKFPGSTNDAFIWNQSNVQRVLRNLHQRGYDDYFLLGDSGYPLRTWLLIPFEEVAPNTPEHNYNIAHKTTRAKIECCNGLLKGRFRCLLKHRVLHYKPVFASKIINACVVLHNLCIQHNIPEPDPEDQNMEIDFGIYDNDAHNEHEDPHDNALRRINPELVEGRRVRARVAAHFR